MDFTKLFKATPCNSAQKWIAAQPDQSLAVLYASCPRGDWLLWALDDLGLDTTAIGYWCAERARQTTLQVLDAARAMGYGVDRLRACAPVVDRETAWAARSAAVYAAGVVTYAAKAYAVNAAYTVDAAYAMRAANAAYAAADAASAAARVASATNAEAGAAACAACAAWSAYASAAACAAWSAYASARDAEHQAIADHVREVFPWPIVEQAIAPRMA